MRVVQAYRTRRKERARMLCCQFEYVDVSEYNQPVEKRDRCEYALLNPMKYSCGHSVRREGWKERYSAFGTIPRSLSFKVANGWIPSCSNSSIECAREGRERR